MRSHACAPVPFRLSRTVLRVLFASRDDRNRSHIGYFDCDLENDYSIVGVSHDPVLEPGALGCFDDHGIYASSIVTKADRLYLYTIGWNPGVRQPLFYASIGLAVSDDGGTTFRRHSSAPIMARSEHDPCSVTGPMVLFEKGRFRMWYVSGYRWDESDGELHSRYNIKYGESPDGISWKRDGIVSIEHPTPAEKNIGRPFVRASGDRYEAWYGYNRGEGYRIGYGESADGIRFERKDEDAGIAPDHEGPDSLMMAHPHIVRHEDRDLMFYNGNQFGREGVLLAVRDIE